MKNEWLYTVYHENISAYVLLYGVKIFHYFFGNNNIHMCIPYHRIIVT